MGELSVYERWVRGQCVRDGLVVSVCGMGEMSVSEGWVNGQCVRGG